MMLLNIRTSIVALLISCEQAHPDTAGSQGVAHEASPGTNRTVSGQATQSGMFATSTGDARSNAQRVSLGITVLLEDSLHLVRGKRVGLITNHTGRDERGRASIDVLANAPGVRLTALFAPEHGIRGAAEGGKRISSSVDKATGVPIHSLYGASRVPTARMLAGVDVLVYDIQDVGARMYTYVWTMTLAAEAAKKAGKRLIVLDRPNPIRGDLIEGGFIERRYRSFTGLHNVMPRYGLTPGELALYLAGTKQIDANITVVPMKGYRASMWWDETGLSWVGPSPNIPDVEAALLYNGTGLFEATNVSEGRGTNAPFRLVGASWLSDADEIARAMNARRLPGVRFAATSRRIAPGEEFGGKSIPMVSVRVTSRDSVRVIDAGAYLLQEIYRRHPREFRWQGRGIEEISGSRSLREAVERGNVADVLAQWRHESAQFAAAVAPYRLYPR
ncbi:MAG: DUF1343 domain-containing protein [Gemmatimonadaceae bacterium]